MTREKDLKKVVGDAELSLASKHTGVLHRNSGIPHTGIPALEKIVDMNKKNSLFASMSPEKL